VEVDTGNIATDLRFNHKFMVVLDMTKESMVQRILDWPFRGRQLRAMKARESYTKSNFQEHLSNAGGDSEVIEEVWTMLTGHAIDGFRPKPEDNLQHIFGLAEEDLDKDVVLKLLETYGCRIPNESELASMKPVDTVQDLVMFVSALKPQ
jgi:hypothetical protein